jgi:hypothetical protein
MSSISSGLAYVMGHYIEVNFPRETRDGTLRWLEFLDLERDSQMYIRGWPFVGWMEPEELQLEAHLAR